MRKIGTVLIGVASAAALLTITACKELFADIEEDFSYWAAEVVTTDYSIDKQTRLIGGVSCVPSADHATVTIKLRNPKNFRLVTPTSSANAQNVISFPDLSPQPTYGTDYTLIQTANDKLELKYDAAFLQTHEWSDGDIGPEITLVSTDGRKFNKKFRLNLKVNTAPALEYAGIGKTVTADSDGNYFYVLLFRAKDMGTTIGGQSVHKDINAMNVTAGGISLPAITLSVTGTDFAPGGDLLAAGAVQKLKPSDPNLPTGSGFLRLKTDVKVGGPEKVYDVSIKDEQGLSSEVIRASTQKNKLSDVELLDGLTPIAGTTDLNPKVFGGMSIKTLTAKTSSAGAGITGSIAKRNSGGTWTQISGGTVSGTTPVTINLPALGTSENEALYKITLKAQLSGYDDSDSKDFFIKSVRQELPVLKLKQDFNDTGNTYLHCISAGTKAYVSEDIIPDAGYYNSSSNPLVIYAADSSSPTPKLVLRASAGTMVNYDENDTGIDHLSAAPAEIQLSGTGTYKIKVWTVKDGIAGPGTTVHFEVKTAVDTYTELKNVVQNAPEHGTGSGQYDYADPIDIRIDTDLNASSADTEIAVTGGKDLMLSGSPFGTVRTVNAGGLGRILKISDSDTELTLSNIKLTGGHAADGKGGAVCVETGCSLWLYGKTVIIPSTGGDTNTRGKNDVYLADGAKIKLDDALQSPEPIVARITPEHYNDGDEVLGGGSIGSGTPPNYTKFTVTQTDDGFLWKIQSDGKLKKAPGVINGTEGGAWKKLKDAVAAAQDGDTIKISGTITAKNGGSDNRGKIDINKNLTIEKADGAASAGLNANRDNLGTNAHPIFRVSGGKTLTLKNLTLTGGKGISGTFGGAINVTGGSSTAELEGCTIEDCQAEKGGAIGCGTDTEIKLTNTRIKNCTAHTAANTGTGGAIYAEGATVTMTGCTLTGNKADKQGGAICAEKTGAPSSAPSTVTIEGGTIGGMGTNDANTATGTGANEGQGGGIYINETCTLTMKAPAGSPAQGVQLIGNKAAKEGGGIYAKNATVNITSCTFTGNEAANGGAVYVIAGDRKLTLTAVNMNNNHAELKGGAVYFVGRSGNPNTELTVQGGEFTGNKATDTSPGEGGAFALITANALMEGVKIKQNFARQGAGICVGTDGSGTTKLTLTDSGTYGLTEISNNGTLGTLTAENGGGIYFIDGTLDIKNGVHIKQNKAQNGGGIYVIDASCSMFTSSSSSVPEISGNTATAFGAGIYLHKSSDTTRLTMSGGKISGNRVVDTTGNLTGEGGGIYTELAAEIRLNKGTIENNQAEKGGAVYANPQCDFSMKNSARITPSSGSDKDKPGQNDVYLAEHASGNEKIKLDGALTGTAPVARITVADSQYNSSTQVLDGSAVGTNYTKFAVTPKIVGGTPQPWTVGGNGYLKQGRYTEVPYGQLEAYLANASATEVNYIEVTGISAADLKGTYASPPDPGPLGELLKKDLSKKVALKLPSGLSVNDMSACFSQCTNLVSFENFPSNVTDMRACFYDCENLTTVPAIPASVTDIQECFRYCKKLTTGPDIPSGVFNMTSCFQGCEKLERVKLNCNYNSFNFGSAFRYCDSLPNGGIQVPLAQLGTYKANAGTMGTTADKFSAIP
ncbi:PF03382 family protein [Treponema socranskii subsp. socranskii VPI DR56BR1116 = ATCC 35536]|uniref:PF03382 family protein n=1 Tax=Treponema socranskii subsp. socranskii VPI DR56BR1116 = ATCC 35536 TaxID=1125725 RepID=U2MLX9_TRESO|nr:leucine-rich repeat domain-containing protein [Treponema socranskii]ERF60663.1 PF03382 family protein [Treponema socranskii subsp. socranskii VPI DR56BR1116 = ATCC 35536]ERK02665.1 PF03382 family protein [Treponema socranskii subsp. socranskii VPI DR56BR1116 = ATCC 35536]